VCPVSNNQRPATDTAPELADPGWLDPAELSERARSWAATMHARATTTGADGIDVHEAHRDTSARLGPTGLTPVLREEREQAENALLASGATRSHGAGSRLVEEPADPLRTCFERDRDRILHSTAYRRLSGKTQVFVFPSDHQRTRLTHALEVAQIARSIAQSVRANVALTEAIAIGHDCGHGPGGHASEDALAPFVDGGYDHATWGADVVLTPLNLCAETLDGIRNHSWSRPAPATVEGEIVSWADRIAYVCHDFEDAASTGVVAPADLPVIVAQRCGHRRSQQLNAFVRAMVATAARSGRIGMDAEMAEALAVFRRFNYERIYLRPESRDQARLVHEVITALVEHLAAHPGLIPASHTSADGVAHSTLSYRAAVTWVGGMTDRFVFDTASQLLDWPSDKTPRGIR
jgi:dGTPase